MLPSTMARRLRLEYPGAIYHVMNRGDRREPIFADDEDRQKFLGWTDEDLWAGLKREPSKVELAAEATAAPYCAGVGAALKRRNGSSR